MVSSDNKRKVIMVDPNKCTGCHGCEMACSLEHHDLCSPNYSRIRIQEFRETNTFIPVMCQGCDDAVCIKYCPANARVKLSNGAVVTDEERCIGCRACVAGCPFGAININPANNKPISCDLCVSLVEGPACVRACTMQKALQFVDMDACGKMKSREWARVIQKDYAPPGANNADSVKKAGYGLSEDEQVTQGK